MRNGGFLQLSDLMEGVRAVGHRSCLYAQIYTPSGIFSGMTLGLSCTAGDYVHMFAPSHTVHAYMEYSLTRLELVQKGQQSFWNILRIFQSPHIDKQTFTLLLLRNCGTKTLT